VPLTTDVAVIAILNNYDTDVLLTPFIEVAADMVVDICVDSSSYIYTSAKRELIERWLSAHFYEMREARVTSESAGSVSESRSDHAGFGLDLTRYGQMVKRIDTNGLMASHDVKVQKGTPMAGVLWLGTGDDLGNDSTYDRR
jgi:hypothetical protein